MHPEANFILKTTFDVPAFTPEQVLDILVNDQIVRKVALNEELIGENIDETPLENVRGDPGTVTLKLDRGQGELHIKELEIVVHPSKRKSKIIGVPPQRRSMQSLEVEDEDSQINFLQEILNHSKAETPSKPVVPKESKPWNPSRKSVVQSKNGNGGPSDFSVDQKSELTNF